MSEQKDTTADRAAKASSNAGGPSKKLAAGRVLGKTEALGDFVFKSNTKDQVEACIRAIEEIADYMGVECSKDQKMLVKYYREKEFTKPEAPPANANKVVMEQYKAELAEYVRSKKEYEKHKAKTFLVILGQCSQQVKSRLDADPDFMELEASDDVIGLLKKIKAIAMVTDDVQHPMWTAVNQVGKLAAINQGPAESLTSYYRRFGILQEVVELGAWGENMYYPPKFLKTIEVEERDEDGNVTGTREENNAKEIRAQYQAMNFLKGLDRKRYGKLLQDLRNSYISGKNNYPATLEAALNFVSNYQYHAGVPQAVDNDYAPQMASFTQTQMSRVKCFACGEKGHISKECPKNKRKRGHVHNQVEDEDDEDHDARPGSGRKSPSGVSKSAQQKGWLSDK